MSPGHGRDQAFASTHWSLVANANDDDGAVARASLAALCLRYWYPVYGYLRRSGHAPEQAHRLARGFFQWLVQADGARASASQYGRFRLFLLAELHRYLTRAPGAADPADPDPVPPPALGDIEARHHAEPAGSEPPECALRRGFAVEVLAAAHARLRREAAQAGRTDMYESLERFLGVEPDPGDYEAIAADLGMRPVSISLAVRRLRQRFRELVDRELRETSATPGDLEDERHALLQVLKGAPE